MRTYLFFLFLAALFFISCRTTSSGTRQVDQALTGRQTIPQATFIHQRIYVNLPINGGDSIRLYTDTGGGKLIFGNTVDKLGLPIDTLEGGMEMVELGPWLEQWNIPPTVGGHFVYREENTIPEEPDGLLGANWFADKIWHFDYQEQTLSSIQAVNWDALDQRHTVPLGFMSDSLGHHLTHFPRIPIVVAGETIQTLFDTGAMVWLSESAQDDFEGEVIGTSFIIASIFDRWEEEYPEWPVIRGADRMLDTDMIQVPKVKIGGYEVGPVWFTKRADKNFTEFMSQWMDQPVQGALGGSALRYFKTVLVDYAEEKAWFER